MSNIKEEINICDLSKVLTARELAVYAFIMSNQKTTFQKIGDALGITRQAAHFIYKIANLKVKTL